MTPDANPAPEDSDPEEDAKEDKRPSAKALGPYDDGLPEPRPQKETLWHKLILFLRRIV